LPPFGPDWPGEKVAYSRDCAPLTDEILGSMVAIGIGPRFTQEDADDIAAAIVKTAGQINTNPKEQNQ
jgi:hypothetical protein